MSLRIGMLTSGGDCQGLNPAMRGVAKMLYENDPDTEIIGFLEGYHGLMHNNYRRMKERDFSGILTRGGTILGTSRQPFKKMDEPLYPNDPEGMTKTEAMVANYKDMSLDALVVLGGNGTQKTANLLSENGCNVIHLPKTIDNDLYGTDITFGFQSAVNIATEVIDGIHSTATSHGRVFIVEIMGHKVGWLTLYSGVAGGADVILIPEIPYDPISVVKALKKREERKKRFSIIAIAEGAMTKEEAAMSKSDREEAMANRPFGSAAYALQETLKDLMVQEVRCTIPGHFQRGGIPSAYDRLLTTQIGVEAGNMILEGDFGKTIAIQNNAFARLPLSEVAGKLKKVPTDHRVVLAARKTGIFFGDE